MLTTCKAIVTGKRKGQQCGFPKSQDNDYCGRHQRNFKHEQLVNEGKFPCRFFFRGCDEILLENGSCDICKEKYSPKKTKCSQEGCKFRTKGDKYCGKHLRQPFTMKKRRKVLYIVMWKEDVLIYAKKVIVGVVSVGTLEMRKTLLKEKSVLKCIILSNKTPI